MHLQPKSYEFKFEMFEPGELVVIANTEYATVAHVLEVESCDFPATHDGEVMVHLKNHQMPIKASLIMPLDGYIDLRDERGITHELAEQLIAEARVIKGAYNHSTRRL